MCFIIIYFQKKKKILIDFDGENIVIEINKKQEELLEFYNYNQMVRFSLILKVRTWIKDKKTYYSNDLLCNDLKIIKTLNYDKEPITYCGSKYVLSKNSGNNLTLSLYNIESNNFLKINHNYESNHIDFCKTHIFFKEELGTDLLELLYCKGILRKGFHCRTQNNNGYLCEVLVLNLFNSNGFLPINYQGLLHISNEYSAYYTLHNSYSDEDETDYSHFNEDLDFDQQSDEFWNQF